MMKYALFAAVGAVIVYLIVRKSARKVAADVLNDVALRPVRDLAQRESERRMPLSPQALGPTVVFPLPDKSSALQRLIDEL